MDKPAGKPVAGKSSHAGKGSDETDTAHGKERTATTGKKGSEADRQGTAERDTRKAKAQIAGSEPFEADKEERFQLPGSLLVKIKDYEGSLTKWGIMVILDDSRYMARKTKSWSGGRSRTAATLVEKLPDVVTPGSKIAVRDFLCRKSTRKKSRGVCLSHMLYDWAGSPFNQLQETLERSDPAGWNNPVCGGRVRGKKGPFRPTRSFAQNTGRHRQVSPNVREPE